MLLMSKYTTTFNNFCESIWELDGKNEDGVQHSRKEKINYGLDKIFDFDYPIWNPDYKKHLEYLIVNHFYLDEIAYETWGQFKMYLEIWLNEEMPRFNVLYQAGTALGDVFTIGYHKTDEFHGTDMQDKDNTGTQSNVGEKLNTGTQQNNDNKVNTGTQKNTSQVDDTGKQLLVDDGTHNEWVSNRDVANGNAYQNDEYVSKATNSDAKDDNTRTRTDDLHRNVDDTRTDNLKEVVDSTRTDDLKENTDFTRTDDLNEHTEGKEDNKRTIQMVYDVQDKMELYRKLWEYYNNVDSEIISGLGVLFMQVW